MHVCVLLFPMYKIQPDLFKDKGLKGGKHLEAKKNRRWLVFTHKIYSVCIEINKQSEKSSGRLILQNLKKGTNIRFLNFFIVPPCSLGFSSSLAWLLGCLLGCCVLSSAFLLASLGLSTARFVACFVAFPVVFDDCFRGRNRGAIRHFSARVRRNVCIWEEQLFRWRRHLYRWRGHV